MYGFNLCCMSGDFGCFVSMTFLLVAVGCFVSFLSVLFPFWGFCFCLGILLDCECWFQFAFLVLCVCTELGRVTLLFGSCVLDSFGSYFILHFALGCAVCLGTSLVAVFFSLFLLLDSMLGCLFRFWDCYRGSLFCLCARLSVGRFCVFSGALGLSSSSIPLVIRSWIRYFSWGWWDSFY